MAMVRLHDGLMSSNAVHLNSRSQVKKVRFEQFVDRLDGPQVSLGQGKSGRSDRRIRRSGMQESLDRPCVGWFLVPGDVFFRHLHIDHRDNETSGQLGREYRPWGQPNKNN